MNVPAMETTAMSERKPARPPIRGGWFLRLARQRRAFHNALIGAGGTPRAFELDDFAPDLRIAKPGIE